MYDTIKITQDARGVATLTLDRPEKRNALSAKMIAELEGASRRLGTDDTIRAVILAANGDVFCAGGDLDWMLEQVNADRLTRQNEAERLAKTLFALNTMPKPLIGRIHGDAFGGGVGLMSICDTVICAKGPRFGLTETKLGLLPATIGPYVLARMGEAKARSIFMSAKLFDATEACNLGLVSKVVKASDLDKTVEEEVMLYLSCAPGAVAEAKAFARSFGPTIDANAIDRSIQALVTRWESPESVEGISAFFDKRKPNWVK